MISVSRQSWIYGLFAWSLGICEEFCQKNFSPHLEDTNLCRFVQTILVYAPLVLFTQVATVGAVVYATLVLPARLFGLGGYFVTLAAIALGIALFVGAVVGAIKSGDVIGHLMESQPVQLAAQYVEAKKRKICPLLRFS